MSNRSKWLYTENEDKAISEEGTEDIVMYIDDLKPEVVTEIVLMWNAGESIDSIQKALDKNDNVSLDEVDYVVEQVKNYEALGHTAVESASPVKTEPIKKESPVVETGTGKPEGVPVVQKELTRGEKAAATRKVNGNKTVAKPVGNSKVLTDPDVVIQSLQNMIEVVEYIKQVQCPEIKDTSAKVTRDLMVEFRKEIDIVKGKYLQQIQQL